MRRGPLLALLLLCTFAIVAYRLHLSRVPPMMPPLQAVAPPAAEATSASTTIPEPKCASCTRLVCIADSHDPTPDWLQVPDGDVLIFAGDFSRRGSTEDIDSFNTWLGTLPHPHKVVISGNMDLAAEALGTAEVQRRFTNAIYLSDSGTDIDGIRYYGSAFTPEFYGAFQLTSGAQAREVANRITDDVDVLITHGPPREVLDSPSSGGHVGCAFLREKVESLKPTVHVFGHIHASYGVTRLAGQDTVFTNCAQFDGSSDPRIQPVVIDI